MNYGYDYGAADSMIGITTAMAGLGAAIFIFSLIIGLISIISYAKIFTKAGKPWWASIVPIYNIIVMLEIAKLPLWYFILLFIPIANIYVLFKINIEIAKKFDKSTGFGIGMTLLSVIFIPLLAFSDNTYEEGNKNTNITNQQFDVTNVINSSVEKETNNNIINEIPVAPIEVSNNLSVETEPTPVSITEEPVQSVQTVEPINTFDAEPMVSPVSPVEEPVQNVENVEPNNAFNIEPTVSPVNPVEESVRNVENVEPINAFNIEPTVSPISTFGETEQNNATTIESLNVETNIVTNIEPQVNIVGEKAKKCKNCGNELPDIVSICPNCGTDNE